MSISRKRSDVIRLKRVYDPAAATDGRRFLVERLWPRGVKKIQLKLDGWLKEAAPSSELRQWFGHEPAKWTEFKRRYFAELRSNPGAVERVVEAARSGSVTFVFSSHDVEHNNAVALKEFVEARLKRKPPSHKRAA
jgi:uncharacterized protein YeaO (DUF488 family)